MKKPFVKIGAVIVLLLFCFVVCGNATPAIKVAYVTATGKAGADTSGVADTLDTKIYPLVKSKYDVTLFAANPYGTSTAISADSVKKLFKDYDLVICSETVGGANKLGLAMENLVGYKPFLNFKAYFYTVSGRWGWAAPVNGASQAGAPKEYKAVINEGYKAHPMFSGATFAADTIQMLDSALTLRSSYYKGFQGFTTSTLVAGYGSLIGKPIGTSTATCFHEINTDPAAKYLLMAICSDNYDKINANGLTVIDNAISYLLDTTAVFNVTPLLTSFSVDGKTCTIDTTSISTGFKSKQTAFSTAFSVYPSLTTTMTINDATVTSAGSIDYSGYLGNANPSTVVLTNGTASSTYKLYLDVSPVKVAYVTATGLADTAATTHPDTLDTKIYPLLTSKYAVTLFAANPYGTSTAISADSVKKLFKDYDLVVASESIGGTNKLGLAMENLVGYKPFLNFKAYFYTVSGRWGWAAPVNGASQAGAPKEYKAVINEGYKAHPMFSGATFAADTIQMLDSALTLRSSYYKGFQGFTTSTLVAGYGSLIGKPIGTSTATCFHEINTDPAAKYLLMAICSDNYDKINANGLTVIDNAVTYLLDTTAVYNATPTVSGFTVDGNACTIKDDTISVSFESPVTSFTTAFSVYPSLTTTVTINGNTVTTGSTIDYSANLGDTVPSTVVLTNGTASSTYKLYLTVAKVITPALSSLTIGSNALTISADSTIADTIYATSTSLKTDFVITPASAVLTLNGDTIASGDTIDYSGLIKTTIQLVVRTTAYTAPYTLYLDIIDPMTVAKPVLTTGTRTDSSLIVSWSAITDATSYSLMYGPTSGEMDTIQTTELTDTITGLTAGSSYSFVLFATSARGIQSLLSDTLVLKTKIKTYDGDELYYTDFLSTPITYPATGNLYKKTFTADTTYTFGTTTANTLSLYVPANAAGEQRMHFNNVQAVNATLGADYAPATENDMGATKGSIQILSRVGAYFVTPKVAGPAKITLWVADGGPGDAKTTISRQVGSATFTDATVFTSGNSNKCIYKYVYESEDADSVQFKIAPGNVKIYLYNIKIQSLLPSTQCDISSFTFGVEGEADTIIAPSTGINGKINIGLPAGTAVTALAPTIITSANATTNPVSGVAQDFTSPVQYTVTAQDGTTQQFYDVTVTVAKEKSKACDVKALTIKGKTGIIDTTAIDVTLFKNQGPLDKFPVIFTLSDLATASISSGDSLDFTSGSATLTVTAQDTSVSQVYMIYVTVSDKPVFAYITKSGTAGPGTSNKDTLDTKFYPTIAAKCDLDLISADSYNSVTYTDEAIKTMFASYDGVFCSETVDGTNTLGIGLKYLVGYKPFLNTKAYFYTVSGRWGWADPVNGASQTGVPVEYSVVVNAGYKNHPIFTGTTFNEDTVQLLDSDLRLLNSHYKGFQGFTTSEINDSVKGSLIASPIGTLAATCIHEINTEPAAKYLLLAVCSDNFDKVNADGVTVINNAIDYLLSTNVYVPVGLQKETAGIRYYTQGQTLFLQGLESGSLIEVYSLSGMKLHSEISSGSTTTVPVKGMNIIRISSEMGSTVLKTVTR